MQRAGDRRSPLQMQRMGGVGASGRTTPSVSHSADSYPPLHSLTIRHCRSASQSCLNSVPHWNSRLLLPPQAAQPSVPQSARASSLVSVDSLSSLFVATGDARIAHLGEGGLVTSPASRRNRICAVTPARRPPCNTHPERESRGPNGPLVVESRGGNASSGGLSGQRPDRSPEAEPLAFP